MGKNGRRGASPLVYLTEDERRALMAVIKVPRDRAMVRLAMRHVSAPCDRCDPPPRARAATRAT